MFVDVRTVRLVGLQIKHGPRRRGFPVVSQIEKRSKETEPTYENKWRDEFLKSGKTVQVLEEEAAEAAKEVTRLEKEFHDLKDDIETLTEKKRVLRSDKDQQVMTSSSDGDRLWQTKQELRPMQKSYLDLDVQLRRGRAKRHRLNMMVKAAPGREEASSDG